MSDDGHNYTESKDIRGTKVLYFDYSGKVMMVRTGEIPFRATNPCSLTRQNSRTIGTCHGTDRHVFGVYPDEESGFAAAIARILKPDIQEMTLDHVCNFWVTGKTGVEPPDTDYKHRVMSHTGYILTDIVKNMDENNLAVGLSYGEAYDHKGTITYLKLYKIVACHTKEPHKKGPIVRFDFDDGTSAGLKKAIELADNCQIPGVSTYDKDSGTYLACHNPERCTSLDSLKVDEDHGN